MDTSGVFPSFDEVIVNDPSRSIKWYNVIGVNTHFPTIFSTDFEKFFTLEETTVQKAKTHCNLVTISNGWTDEEVIILDIIFNDKSYDKRMYVFSFLAKTWRIIFVKVSKETSRTDVLNEPFLFNVLRNKAVELISIPLEKIISLYNKLDSQKDLQKQFVFLFNTGRCGSTLSAKVIGIHSNIISLQEPDICSSIIALYPSEQETDIWPSNEQDKIKMKNNLYELFSICHWIQFISIAGEEWKNSIVLFKLRTQSTGLIETYYNVFPQAKYYFMYRNGIKTVSSFYKIMIQFKEIITQLHPTIEGRFNRNQNDILQKTGLKMDNDNISYLISCFMWYDNMLHIIRFLENHGHESVTSFRYEEFVINPHHILNVVSKTVASILDIDLKEYRKDYEQITNIMSVNSQKGSIINSELRSSIHVDETKISEIISIIHSKYPKENITYSSIIPNTLNKGSNIFINHVY